MQREAFYNELTAFLAKQGISLQEPILGGKRLDLHKIYQYVVDHGGFDKVTQDKGWRKVTTGFNLPDTCTNAAYTVKSTYQKYLLGWEQVMYWGKDIKDIIFEPDLKKPITPPVKTTPPRLFQPPPTLPVQVIPPQKESIDKFLSDGHQSRILLAIQSGLVNEVEWGILKILEFSYQCSSNFHLDLVPGLLDSLLLLVEPFFDELQLNTCPANFSTTLRSSNSLLPRIESNRFFNLNNHQQSQFDNAAKVLQILHNFSFIHYNAKIFANENKLISMIAKGIALPESSFYVLVRQDCLTIFENISQFIAVRGTNDFFVTCLCSFIFSNDRTLIISSLCTLRTLCSAKVNHAIFKKDAIHPDAFIVRVFELLIVDDPDLVSAALDHLYEYSSLGDEACKRLANMRIPQIGNVIIFIARFLNYSNGLRPLLQNVSCLKTELDDAVEFGSICKWGKLCGEKFSNETQLVNHVVSQHMNADRVKCCWKGCSMGELGSVQVKSHLWSHYPLTSVSKTKVIDGPMLSGIPLTALLLTRNLAKFSSGGLSVIEGDLAVLTCEPAYTRIASQILTDIEMYEDGNEV